MIYIEGALKSMEKYNNYTKYKISDWNEYDVIERFFNSCYFGR